ncbi:MAG: hypothetical protein LBS59_05045 [Puniceicoccales bacterium]|jgi:NAD-dependent dihydropyrimidine dehydrogenase PreA subunit|nr:hypothetical protein [Puniceicoccales bacterium]
MKNIFHFHHFSGGSYQVKRRIIEFDASKGDGCGLCADACHENAIGIVGGVAKLLCKDCCDGFGNCLPACSAGEIAFIEREEDAYDEEGVKMNQQKIAGNGGGPSSKAHSIKRLSEPVPSTVGIGAAISELRQCPAQSRLVFVNAVYFDGANLFIAADCAA